MTFLLINRVIDYDTYLSLIDFVTSFRGGILLVCGGISNNKRPGQANGNFCTRHNDDGQRNEIHHNKQNDEKDPPEIPCVTVQLVKAVRAKLPGQRAKLAGDGERFRPAETIGCRQNGGNDPSSCDDFLGS